MRPARGQQQPGAGREDPAGAGQPAGVAQDETPDRHPRLAQQAPRDQGDVGRAGGESEREEEGEDAVEAAQGEEDEREDGGEEELFAPAVGGAVDGDRGAFARVSSEGFPKPK